MPIKVKQSLPARDILEKENIFVMTETRAMTQDIRPLKVLVLNLMPTKIVTETQILRKLSNRGRISTDGNIPFKAYRQKPFR